MKAVVDTHALIWFMENNSRLGAKAKSILLSPEVQLLIPVIVLAELYYYLRKKHRAPQYGVIYQKLQDDPRVVLRNLEPQLITKIPDGLELHDGLIAAVALESKEVVILTQDREITSWDSERVVWD